MNRTKPNYIILTYKSQGTEMLFRAEDGICIGQWKDQTVIFGEDPQKKQARVFLNAEYAAKFLRTVVPVKDLEARHIMRDEVLIEERDGEPIITLAPGTMKLADLAPRRMTPGTN